MQLTKTKEKEILKVYDTWMTAYLNADVDTYDRYFDEDYHFIGSTDNEEFLNRKDTTEFFKASGNQFAGLMDLRNESKILEQFGDHIFLTHNCDTWFKNGEDWSYYGRFRLSSVLHLTKEGWKFIYQHFSMPDSKSDEGQTIGFDKVNTENQELREAIKRRTIELEAKNRELEIEGALERIRAQAVAMQQSTDLLDIVVTMRNEFTKLGHQAHYFWHMMWLPETYEKAMTSGEGNKIGFVMKLPRHMHGDIPLLAKWEKSKEPTVVYAMNTDEAIDYVDKMIKLGDFQNIDPQAPTHKDIKHIGGLTFIMARTTHGEIGYSLPGIIKNPPVEDLDILVQFAGAFDLAHRRFLDLQKAETQTREIQIELSLERIRSRVTAMKESSDLFNIVVAMRKEFISLGHEADYFWHMQWLPDNYEMSMTSEDGSRVGMVITIPKFVHDNIATLATWEKGNDPICVLALNAKEAWDYIDQMNTHGQYKKADPNAPTEEDIHHIGGITFIIARTTHGEIGYSLPGVVDNPPKAALNILLRFAGAFDLAHKRFEDLKRSEQQARETQVELALEKVRSRTMAMEHSDELQETSFLLDEQVRGLGIETWGCAFHIYGEQDSTEWFGNKAGVLHTYTVPREGIFKYYYQKGQEGESILIKEFYGNECIAHYSYMSTLPVIGDVLKTLKKTNDGFPTYQMDHVVYFKYGYLLFITRAPVPEAHDIFKRFAQVFEQTYTRFLDLKKAEAQTREAQIEAALEKVRSRSLAMHGPEELQEVVAVVAEKLQELGVIYDAGGVILCTYFQDNKDVVHWISVDDFTTSGRYFVPYFDNPIFNDAWDSKMKGDAYFTKSFPVEVKNDFFKQAFENSDYKQMPDDYKQFVLNADNHHLSAAWSKNSAIIIPSLTGYVPSESDAEILKRFAKVFEQAYIRFMDLQKSEAQAREAQIEHALEKVRSRTMAMQHSKELPEAANNLFLQVQELGIPAWSAGYCIWEDDKKSASCNMSSEGEIQKGFSLPTIGEGYNFYDPYKKGKEFHVAELGGKQLVKHYDFMKTLPNVGDILEELEKSGLSLPTFQIFHIVYLKFGYVMFITYEAVPKAHDIFKRFGKVFNQTYTRFLDLERAEAQAREAQIEMALEKVRSRTLAMQTSEELADTSVIVFKQLLELGIAPNRLFIGIINEDANGIEAWATNEDGSKIDQHFKLYTSKNKTIKKIVDGWKQKLKTTIIDMHGKELQDYFHYLNKVMHIPFIDGLEQTRRVQSIAYFSGGLIGMAAPEEQPKETIELLERFAAVFNLTYTRFKDLKVAEANAEKAKQDLIKLQVAKKSAEEALSELQATQKQLIQSEKMASLGELTAGIAHEIQNPLNFVNNFSDVSKELLDEMLEEMENGDLEEARAIMADVIQNLEKINHHGKRADGIVKGMLQHSRASGDKKDFTDINALADEYLRLAYHGLRAKDKSFNAQLDTDFDTSIESIEVIPQDIGRVILNLLTNAFYAVNEKQKSGIEDYVPIVGISSIKKKNSIIIIVKDNGYGMPERVREKIFQPFFTTKPTGQGTGLGLSMSYDIVTKGHGGELLVETKERIGTTFSIVLPIKPH